jgi:hypothetical protein
MAEHSVGRIFVELDLDSTRYMKSQRTLLQEAKSGATTLEKNFKNLGIKSGATFDLMRAQAVQSLEAIKRSGKATTDDIIRAEKAKNETINRLNEQQFGKHTSLLSSLKSNWLATTAAITASIMALQKAWNYAEQAAQYEQSSAAFYSMMQSMGKNAEAEFAKINKASAGLIDKKTLTEASNRALSLGIPIEKVADLLEIARAKARDMGISTSQAFNDIATGVGRASPLILDNLGLVMKVGSANKAMAASLGKTVGELTDQEKKTAILNTTLDAGKEALTRYDLATKTTKEKMETLTATIKDLQLVLGQGLIRAAAGTVGAFQYMAGGILGLVSAYSRYRALVYDMIGNEKKQQENLLNATAAWEAREALIKSAKDNFEAMVASADDLSKAMAQNATVAIETGRGRGIEEATKEDTKAHELAVDLYIKDEARKWEELEKYYKEYYAGLNKALDQEIAVAKANVEAELQMMKDIEEGVKASMKTIEKETGTTEEIIETRTETMADKMADAFSGWANSFSRDLNDMLWDSEKTFSDIATSFGKMITQMITQLYIVEPLMKGVTGMMKSSGGIGGLFSGLFGGTSYAPAHVGVGGTTAFGMHSGGEVGRDYSFQRTVPSETFVNAPRYHNGLASDEMPAILQKGETVLPKGENGATQVNITIVAADSKSITDMMRRNPGAVVTPLIEQLESGNRRLQTAIRMGA